MRFPHKIESRYFYYLSCIIIIYHWLKQSLCNHLTFETLSKPLSKYILSPNMKGIIFSVTSSSSAIRSGDLAISVMLSMFFFFHKHCQKCSPHPGPVCSEVNEMSQECTESPNLSSSLEIFQKKMPLLLYYYCFPGFFPMSILKKGNDVCLSSTKLEDSIYTVRWQPKNTSICRVNASAL